MAIDAKGSLLFSGSLDFDLSTGPRARISEEPSSPTPILSIAGTVVSAYFRYPLPGLSVQAYFAEPVTGPAAAEAGATCHSAVLLGQAISDASGHFVIIFEDSAVVRDRLLLLIQSTDARLILKVLDTSGNELHVSDTLAVSGNALFVELDVSLPETQTPGYAWDDIAARLQQARISQISQFVQELASPTTGQSLFADWSLETRQALLNQLEQDFLDPQGLLRHAVPALPTLSDLRLPGVLEAYQEQLQPFMENAEVRIAFGEMVGKVQSFADMFSVDWPMDMNELGGGNLGAALNKFKDAFEIGRISDHLLLPQFENNLTRYRDYLRAIWVDWVTRVVYIQPHQLTKQQALQQLQRRFHQDFTTFDTFEQPANKVLIPILIEILTAPPGSGWGFGVPAVNIPPQGVKSPREYLNDLIALTGLSAQELGLRYRLDLQRPDSALSSPVQENIATLQGFFRDSFQCKPEPFHVEPDVLNQPIVPDKMQGKAPFFLWYEEWLRQQTPFYGENFFDIRHTLLVQLGQQSRDNLKSLLQNVKQADELADWKLIADVLAIYDTLAEGHSHYYHGEYALALQSYLAARLKAIIAVQTKGVASFDIDGALAERKQMPVKNRRELDEFMDPLKWRDTSGIEYSLRTTNRMYMTFKLLYYAVYVLPVCLGDTYLAMGDYEKAIFHYGQVTRFAVGTAKESDSSGYRPHYLKDFPLYHIGDRPYTVNLHNSEYSEYPLENDTGEYYDTSFATAVEKLTATLVPKYAHPVEAKYFRLRHGNALLEWADALYRSNDGPSIARARELYKGVLFLHGERPPICPDWKDDLLTRFVYPSFRNQNENPALALQKARARLGFYKIEAGLNYYGESNDIVPTLRYRPLKESADRMAALAKASQQDFLLYMEHMETALIERMKLANLLQKATLQASVASEQIKIAEHNVTVAEEQVKNVMAQIAAKQKEIADSESFFSQLGDFIGGMVKTFTALPSGTQGAIQAGFVSELTGKELVGEGMLGLGAGASIMAGFVAFGVAGYMSMESLAAASNDRYAQLRALTDRALPAAENQVAARKREVTIAHYQKQIAQADIDLASALITFQDNRNLNADFWSNLAQIVKRILRRYLELGARVAWLAERALAYEQDRQINIIRLDYFPEKLQGVTGADLLQADLAELEATRIEGVKRSIPVKRTFSLARDFPLQFGRLKQTGRCTFKTSEMPFNLAYPGTTGYRVRAVSVTVNQAGLTHPLRGLLINQGVSLAHPGQPDEHAIVRPAEALPISEFRLQNDMAVYSLPDETLLTFEGSAIETFWELNFPVVANAYGLDDVADVLLTFDLRAQYSPDLYAKQIANMPTTVRRWLWFSAQHYQPQAVKDLAGAVTTVSIPFDLSTIRLPGKEANRKVKNLAIFFVNPLPLGVVATLAAAQAATTVNITFKQGIAMSNIPPTINDPAPPPLPLNALADAAADQLFTLTVDKSQNPGVDFSGVTDVILGVEYQADLV